MKSIDDFIKQIFDMYDEKKLEEAIEVIVNEGGNYKEFENIICMYHALFFCALKENEKAFEVLRSGSLDKNLWLPVYTLENHNWFKPFKEKELFKEIIKVNKQREEELSYSNKYEIEITEPKDLDTSDIKLIMTIHGNNPMVIRSEKNAIKEVVDNFAERTDYKHLVAAPRSSRRGNGGEGYWYSFSEGAAEVGSHIDKLKKQYNIKDSNIYLMGTSYGAGILLKGLLEKRFKIDNICLYMPYLPFLEDEMENIKELMSENTNVYIWSGEKDFCLKYAKELVEKLKEWNVKHIFVSPKDVGHEVPEGELSNLIDEVIKYLEL